MAKRRARPGPDEELPPFTYGPRILREASVQPFSVHREQQEAASHGQQVILPSHRRLTVYTQDPATSQMDVKVIEAQVPYEPLSLVRAAASSSWTMWTSIRASGIRLSI